MKEKFQKDSACYICILCKKQTRATGNGDAARVGLCKDCHADCKNYNEQIDKD